MPHQPTSAPQPGSTPHNAWAPSPQTQYAPTEPKGWGLPVGIPGQGIGNPMKQPPWAISAPPSRGEGDITKEWGKEDKMEKPVVVPSKYDGSTPLAEYLAHFDLCRRVNGWDHRTAGVFLGLSLTGLARRLLSGIEPSSENGYLQLRGALVARFQPPNQAAMYKALLRNKERGKGECLQAHAEEVERYTRLAYPLADLATIDCMAKDRFVESLRDHQLQLWIHQSTATTLLEAVQVALHAEACMRPHGAPQTVRATAQTMGEEVRVLREDAAKENAIAAKFRDTVTQALSGGSTSGGSRPGGGSGGERRTGGSYGGGRGGQERQCTPLSETRCYHCAALGHRRHNCPVWAAQVAAADAKTAKPSAPAAGVVTPAVPTSVQMPSEN